ncbi:hypothetical protein [Sphingomonas sp. AOB5]|uniref:hypothetical protein n=1 Tax=Sphingomonas sp. AOB5 TaxID=3034017 RepID=UPI0023F7DD29|nr:hypothetical protein [Sphingomonas sp. AOB5]
MIARLAALLLLCIAFTAPAQAQLTAVYTPPEGSPIPFEMRIEIAPNGDVRGTLPGQSLWLLTIAGEGYFISGEGKDAKVMRATDVAAVLGEQMKKMMPDMPPIPDGALEMVLTEGKPVTVRGRTGTGWYMEGNDTAPAMVISSDPALAPLGKALAYQFEISTRMMAQLSFAPTGFMDEMLRVLRTGAPLSVSGLELNTVATAPIPADRFVLPAAPLSREEIRTRLEASNWQLR